MSSSKNQGSGLFVSLNGEGSGGKLREKHDKGQTMLVQRSEPGLKNTVVGRVSVYSI